MIEISDSKIIKQVSPYLCSFLTDSRIQRIDEVLNQRTKHYTIVLEDLYQAQNISAVLRTCECYGLQDVYVVENDNEFVIHKAISMGANKWLTIHKYPPEEHNLENCINDLHQRGYTVAATLPSEDSCFIQDIPVEQKTAFIFGTELTGLSPQAISLADQTVKIPMYGFTESFNISNSVAILVSFMVEKLRKTSMNWQLTESEKEQLRFEWLQKSLKTPDLIINKFLSENCLDK